MKPYVCTKTDWEYDVIDVFLIIESMDDIHLKGFDDVEWREADDYAKAIATVLNLEFVGDRTDT